MIHPRFVTITAASSAFTVIQSREDGVVSAPNSGRQITLIPEGAHYIAVFTVLGKYPARGVAGTKVISYKPD